MIWVSSPNEGGIGTEGPGEEVLRGVADAEKANNFDC